MFSTGLDERAIEKPGRRGDIMLPAGLLARRLPHGRTARRCFDERAGRRGEGIDVSDRRQEAGLARGNDGSNQSYGR